MNRIAHRPVSDRHRERAKALRREMTDAERKLWTALRGHRFHELAFRRQAPIGAFIVDFVCHAQHLIVEVDGGQHDVRSLDDKRRDAWLVAKGYRVLRYWNNDVMSNLEGVLQSIADAVESVPPSLTLPRKGGGKAAHGTMPAITNNEPPPLPDPPPQGERKRTGARSETAS